MLDEELYEKVQPHDTPESDFLLDPYMFLCPVGAKPPPEVYRLQFPSSSISVSRLGPLAGKLCAQLQNLGALGLRQCCNHLVG